MDGGALLVLRHSPEHHDIRQRFDGDPRGQTPCEVRGDEFIDQRQYQAGSSILGSSVHEIVVPHMIGPLRPQPKT